MTEDGSLTTKKRRAIAGLLSTRTVDEAAKSAGVGARTLARWLAEDDVFRAELRQAEGDAIDNATRQLVNLSEAATAVISDILSDKKVAPGVRLRAATAALDYLLRLRELRNLEERLTTLEERYAQES